MTQITIDKNILLVEVPEDFELKELTKWTLYYKSKGRESCVGLSPGSWQFIGTTDAITEEIAAKIVEPQWYCNAGARPSYPDFTGEWAGFVEQPMRSYQSFLKANKIPSDKRFAILKLIP